jgi:putative oxidoreductase
MRMQWLAKYRETGLLLMRVALGIGFILLTAPVLLGGGSRWASFGSGVRALGIASNFQFWGFLGALAGCLGAVLMIFGLFFRPGVLLVLAITLVHTVGAFDGGGTLRGNLAAVELCAVLVGLLFLGPGKYSVDKT